MADGRIHPLVSGCPPSWASEWGEDEFGVFVEFSVQQVYYRMRWIPPGSFTMAAPDQSFGGPRGRVVFPTGFWLGETPVTQALWEAVTGVNPSHFRSRDEPRLPVDQVSWEDCQKFCRQLGARVPRIRLPTESEWEYACRAGTDGASPGEVDAVGWYKGNSEGQSHPVKQKPPNGWGLYDMLGNVWEWCADPAILHMGEQAHERFRPELGVDRACRGGSWYVAPGRAPAGQRTWYHARHRGYDLGLRLALSE